MTTSTRTTTRARSHPDPLSRAVGQAIVGLAVAAAAVLALSAPATLALARDAGPTGQGAGNVLLYTLGVLLTVAALAALSLHRAGPPRRPVRVAPLVGAAALFLCALAAVTSVAATAVAGNAGGAVLALSASLWLTIAAGAVFGVASLPIAD